MEETPYTDEEANGDSSIHYTITQITGLPFTDPTAGDSTATVYHLRGQYSDDTHTAYTMCTFERVCATPIHTLFSVRNLTVHTFYSLVFTQCHVNPAWDAFPVCRCFHYLYRPALMPYAYATTQLERTEARHTAERMAAEVISSKVDWSKADIEPTRPNLEDFQTIASIETTKKPRLYEAIFTADKSISDFNVSFAPPTTVESFDHYWSINKWVQPHHIAHWTQKLLAWQAVYGHWSHACNRRYRPTKLDEHHTILTETYAYRTSRRVTVNDTSIELDCFPPLTGLLHHDSNLPMTDHEKNILQITVQTVKAWVNSVTNSQLTMDDEEVISHLMFAEELYQQYSIEYLNDSSLHNWQLPPPQNIFSLTCFQRLSMTPLYGLFVENAYDSATFRQTAHQHYGFEHRPLTDYQDILMPKLVERDTALQVAAGGAITDAALRAIHLQQCPPQRAILITRPDREIMNKAEMFQHLYRRYGLSIDVVTIDGSTPSRQQAALFAESGLVLSAHSSQMINVVFAHVSTVMIEITAEFYNPDFAQYARSMGIYFRYALGGNVTDPAPEIDPLMIDCLRAMQRCHSDSMCVMAAYDQACLQRGSFPNKHKPFYANVTAVDEAVRQALSHIHWLCYGSWASTHIN